MAVALLDPYMDPGYGFPKYSLITLRKCQAKIIPKLRRVLDGSEYIHSDIFRRMSKVLHSSLPPLDNEHILNSEPELYDDRRRGIDELLRRWIGAEVTSDTLGEIAGAYAANIDTLRQGRPYMPWDGERIAAWGMLFVADVERIPVRPIRYKVSYRIVAGPGYGITFNRVHTGAGLQRMLRDIGLPRYEKYPPESIFNMYLIAYLSIEAGYMKMLSPAVSSSVKTHNKRVYASRLRPCTGGFEPQGPCVPACPFGVDICSRAYHKETYELSVTPCKVTKLIGGAVFAHTGRATPSGQGICWKCIQRGVTSREIRLTAGSIDDNKK